MKQPSFEKREITSGLIFEYEAMSQGGKVLFFEETAFLEIANWYSKNRLPDRALKAVEDALKYHSLSVDFHIFRVELLLQNGNIPEAVKAINEAQKVAPDDKRQALYRAEAYCLLGKIEQTLHLLAAQKSPMTPEKKTALSLSQARYFQQTDAYDKMFDALAEAAIRQPCNEDVLEELWFCVEVAQNYKDSVALHQTVLDRQPYSYYAWHNLGFALRELGHAEEAMEAFEYSFITNPYFEQGYEAFGGMIFEKGLYNRALQCYQEMMQYLGENEATFVRIGECYQKLGDLKMARDMYEQALKLDFNNAEACFRIGECLLEQKEYARSLKWLRDAIRTEARRETFHAALAEAYRHLGKEKEAIEHYWMAVEIAPDEQQHWVKLVQYYISIGDPQEALEILVSAFENSIERHDLLYCRAACLVLKGERTEAKKHLRKALCNDFARHAILFRLLPTLEQDAELCNIIAKWPERKIKR